MKPRNIRNFSIVAHIDHGKSTLADRLLELTGSINERDMREQVLDTMELERERGITIKAQTARMEYSTVDGRNYLLNLIDTPGHVDFSYEVSKSLQACEGVLLLVDATQGIEAQTLANAYLAVDQGLEIIPLINKIDLPSADIEGVKRQIEETLGLDASGALSISAKEGLGVEDVLKAVVERIPPPEGDEEAPLKALIVDSQFDPYRGAIVLLRVFEGRIEAGVKIRMVSTGREYEVSEVGFFTPRPRAASSLSAGEVGYMVAGIKQVKDTRIGDTITEARHPAETPLPGFKEVKPMVFCGLYPVDSGRYEELRDALDKLWLNDSSFHYEPETSNALGFGFRCGFLGMLQMEIIRERLEREYGLELINTAPTVVYRVKQSGGDMVTVDNPSRLPHPGAIAGIEEPYVKATIILPDKYLGPIMRLAQNKRGLHKGMDYLDGNKVVLNYELPLNEIIVDFYDKLKSCSRGYASLDYEHAGYRASDLVKLDILINGEPVDALSLIVHRDKAYPRGKQLINQLREVIPRQLFEVVIQAAIGNKVIARESVRPLRKNVTAKCYGGDVTRKRKLLERQKEGKKRMKSLGSVEIPQEAFMAVLKLED
jgi:GTP-binding protein LepA